MEKLRVDPWRRPRPFPTETQHTLTRSSPAKAKERWLRRSNGPGPRPEAAGPLNAPGLTPVLLASLRAPHQPACRRGGVPVTPAAPGALADWIDWLQFPLGRSWDFFCPLSPFARSSPSLLDQATLSRFTSSSPVPLLFHFTTFVTVHISIPFAAQGKGSQPPTTPAP